MQEPVFQALKFRRLSEYIENAIKDSILVGDLQVGTRLPSETQIGRQFGVSLMTVREALRGLEAVGIITKKRGKNGGIFVGHTEKHVAISALQTFFSSQHFSVKDLNEVRRFIEPPSVKLAASRITPEELKQIEHNTELCERRLEEKKRSFTKRDYVFIQEKNVEFHRALAEATHNPILALTVEYVVDFLLILNKKQQVPDREFINQTLVDHRKICLALKNGEADMAERVLNHHIELVGTYLTTP